MAAHIQQQILERFVQVLRAAAIVPADRVYLERVDPLPLAHLPALHIEEADTGESTQEAVIHRLEVRSFLVDVHCMVADNGDYAAAARHLGLLVEKAIAADTQLSTVLCKGGVRCMGSRPLRSGDGERAQAERQQRWRCIYYCDRRAPDVVA
jgi:hypothetical protein